MGVAYQANISAGGGHMLPCPRTRINVACMAGAEIIEPRKPSPGTLILGVTAKYAQEVRALFSDTRGRTPPLRGRVGHGVEDGEGVLAEPEAESPGAACCSTFA